MTDESDKPTNFEVDRAKYIVNMCNRKYTQEGTISIPVPPELERKRKEADVFVTNVKFCISGAHSINYSIYADSTPMIDPVVETNEYGVPCMLSFHSSISETFILLGMLRSELNVRTIWFQADGEKFSQPVDTEAVREMFAEYDQALKILFSRKG